MQQKRLKLVLLGVVPFVCICCIATFRYNKTINPLNQQSMLMQKVVYADAANTDSLLESIIAAAEKRESFLHNPSAYFTEKVFFSLQTKKVLIKGENRNTIPKSGPQVNKFFWASDGARWRCDERHVVPKDYGIAFTQTSYDGEQYYSYSPDYEEEVCRIRVVLIDFLTICFISWFTGMANQLVSFYKLILLTY